MDTITPEDVVAFWRAAGMQKWFQGGDAFDRECDERFRDAHFAAGRRELEDWLDTAEGGLALLILLDRWLWLGAGILGVGMGAALLGVVIERLAYKPLRHAPRVSAIITGSLAAISFWRSISAFSWWILRRSRP